MKWINVNDNIPPLPETPYEVYLVWGVQRSDGATGTTYLVQFSRDHGSFMSLGVGLTGKSIEVTHWSDALQRLGAPEPKPYGPRGKVA